MFYIYIIRNLTNNKIYVGKAAKPLQRFAEHKSIANGTKPREFSLIHAALRKYSETNFTFQIIEEWENEADAYQAEEFWIEFLRTDVSKFGKEAGYNVNAGGLGAGSGVANPMFGKTHSDDAKAAMSAKRKGELNPNFGKHFSDKTKSIMSVKKENVYLGENNPRAKLTNTQADAIRNQWGTGDFSINTLASLYGVKRSIVERILRGETYKGTNNG